MKAITLKGFGGVENLELAEAPMPSIADNEVLVKVEAISINPVDAKTRSGRALAGKLKDYHPLILGWDIAGTVIETGASVTTFKNGDNVFGMVNFPGHGQAYAEYVAAPAGHLALKPGNISFEESAAATLAPLTAWEAFTEYGKLAAGDKVLIHAAAGGVGHFAVQIAKHLGAYVIGTSSAENKEYVLSIGADEHIDYRTQRFEDIVHDVDFVLDPVGGDNIERSLQVVKRGGTLIFLPSGVTENVMKKARAKGVNALFFLVHSNQENIKKIGELLEKRIIKPYVSKVYSLAEIQEAHRQIESGKTKGKIVIVPS